MSCLWFLLFCSLAASRHSLAAQGSQPSQVHLKNNHKDPRIRSRNYCDPTYNHTGGNIQDCDPGQYRERRGPYRGQCVPCNCNGLSHQCDQNSGKCLNCQSNTAGDHCERCAEGHYGSAALRTCRVCPCPFSQLSHSFAIGCLDVGDHFECLCKTGYSGTHCERCAIGYYGDPLADGGSCQLCDCDYGDICDSITGQCESPDDANNGDCQECDSCFVTLIDDLEAMDDEFSILKAQVKSYRNISINLTALRKLEHHITATKVLVKNYRESVQVLKQEVNKLEADMDGIRKDKIELKIKADQTSLNSQHLLKDVNKNHQKGQNLLTNIEEVLNRIQGFLEQLKILNGIEPSLSGKVLIGMLTEAQWMVEQMQKQNCTVQRRLAEYELWEARKLLDNIMNNLTSPLESARDTAEKMAQVLRSTNFGLKELEEALKQAETSVNKTIIINDGSEEVLSDIRNHHMRFENKQDDILSDLAMIRGTLRGIEALQSMMNNLKNDYAKLAAEMDGAKSQLNQRLDELSKATAMDGLVRKAEDHAQELMDLAMYFQMSLLNFINTSTVHKAVDMIKAFGDIVKAIKEAEEAANKANKAADHAVVDEKAQGSIKKAKELKNSANSLDDNAKEAENNLKDIAQKYDTVQNLLDKAKGKKKDMQKDIQTLKNELDLINRDHIGALLKQAKDAVQAANKAANNDTACLRTISEELDKIKIPAGESNVDNILNGINKTLDTLNKFFPNLTDTLAEVENQWTEMPSRANMTDNIMRIKDIIERTRELANTIRGPILFSGESHIELRPPKNLIDLQAFTAMDLMLHRPKDKSSAGEYGEEENLFVLYLGNKNTKRDFIGMVVIDGVLYCVYKLGGTTYKIKTEKITQSSITSSFMDRVDFHRVYQDAEVIYTRHYTSTDPRKLPKITNQPNTTVNLLDLGSDDVVFYVGGYPDDFTPPLELLYPKFKGCIEFNTLNEHILSLYNFQHAVNIRNTDRCLRGETREVTKYFDGTGYGKIDVVSSRSVRFFVSTRQQNALLLFMGNEKSHFTITVERGYVVLRITENGETQIERSTVKVFPVVYFQNIKILQSPNKFEMKVVAYSVNIRVNYKVYTQAFIGGIPAVIAERLNINHPALRGCLKGLEVDVAIKFSVAIGIHPGCPLALLGVHEVTLETGSSLVLIANSTLPSSDTMVSLGFKSTQSSGVLLQTGGEDNGFELSLVNGHVEMKDSTTSLKSKNRYDEGHWHYVTAFRNTTGMKLNVDNLDRGDVQTMSTGSMVQDTDVILGKETFNGCIRNFYMRRMENRYIPIDLSNFTQTGLVDFGSCNTQQQPMSIMARSRLRRRWHVNSNIRKKYCSEQVGHTLAYHLNAHSQIQHIISQEELNYRPHIFLDVRTRSASGLLLHITDNYGFARIILFISEGRVTLFVGDGTLISYQKKINNGAWHNIRFSFEQHIAHLVVDGVHVPDGKLQKDEGISLDLQPPVYFGAGRIQLTTGAQSLHFPQESVIGCIRNIKFNDVLIGEPAVNHGGTPCFDGVVEKGTYFAGDGSHIILEKHFMLGAVFNLTFEVRPRNMTGLLFHCRGHRGHSLSVFLKKGTMVVQLNDGGGDYSASVTPSLPLCAESFHRVTVTKKGNVIKLKMGRNSNSAVGSYVYSPSKTRRTLYIGGIPESKRKILPVWSSYVGCLRNVQINQAALSFQSVSSVFGSVNISECPAQ
ncbi:laminin subunit alpha-3 [Clarias gariepinus]